MSGRGLSEEEFEEMLAAAGEGNSGNSVNSMDTEAYLQQQADIAAEEEAARVAAMSPEEKIAYEAQKKLEEEQDKLEEELEELAEELKNEQKEKIRILNESREADLAHGKKEISERKNPSLKRSGLERNRQAFARQAFDEMSKHGDEFGGGKNRTIRKKNRTRTMRKKARKSRNSRNSNKAR